MKNNRNPYPSLPQAWLLFALLVAASIVIGLILAIVTEITGIQNLSPGNFIAYNGYMLFAIWFAWRNRKQTTEKVLQFRSIPPLVYPLLIILTISFAVFLDPLTSLIPMPEFFERLFEMLSKRDIWTFLVVCITGPVLEEVLFRGIILDGFLNRYKPAKAIFWSALLFSLLHMNPWQSIPAFLNGLLLGYIYYRTRNLWPVILIHLVNNTFSYLIMYIYGEEVKSLTDLFTETGTYLLFFSLSTIIMGISMLAVYGVLKKRPKIWTFNSETESLS